MLIGGGLSLEGSLKGGTTVPPAEFPDERGTFFVVGGKLSDNLLAIPPPVYCSFSQPNSFSDVAENAGPANAT